MKKRVFGQKLSRGLKARRALKRSLIRAFVLNGKLTTTKAKLRFVQRDIDKLVGSLKKPSLSQIKKADSLLGGDKETLNRLTEILKSSFLDRKSGFTRVINLPERQGDKARISRLEWTEVIKEKEKADKKNEQKKETDIKNNSPKEKGLKGIFKNPRKSVKK